MLFVFVLQYHRGIYWQRATTTQPHKGNFFQLQKCKDFLAQQATIRISRTVTNIYARFKFMKNVLSNYF